MEREQPRLLADLGARLFPCSSLPLDEATIASVRAIAVTLVGQIDTEITGNDAMLSWPSLQRSRLLGDTAMLNFLLARAAYLRLSQRLPGDAVLSANGWIAHHISDAGGILSDAVVDLLAARSRPATLRLSGRADMPADLFAATVRHIVAALRTEQDDAGAYDAATRAMVADHDERASLPYLSVKIAALLHGVVDHDALKDPARAGLDLFAGQLCRALAMDWHQVIHIMGEGGARLAVLLRAADFSLAEAVNVFAIIQADAEPMPLDRFEETGRSPARTLVAGWLVAGWNATLDAADA